MNLTFSRSAFAGWGGLALALTGCIDQISADLPAPPKVLVMNSTSARTACSGCR